MARAVGVLVSQRDRAALGDVARAARPGARDDGRVRGRREHAPLRAERALGPRRDALRVLRGRLRRRRAALGLRVGAAHLVDGVPHAGVVEHLGHLPLTDAVAGGTRFRERCIEVPGRGPPLADLDGSSGSRLADRRRRLRAASRVERDRPRDERLLRGGPRLARGGKGPRDATWAGQG